RSPRAASAGGSSGSSVSDRASSRSPFSRVEGSNDWPLGWRAGAASSRWLPLCGRRRSVHAVRLRQTGGSIMCHDSQTTRSCRWARRLVPTRILLIAAALSLGVLLSPARAPAAEIPPATKEALRTSDLIYVATKRRNGQPSAAKPIWFYYKD